MIGLSATGATISSFPAINCLRLSKKRSRRSDRSGRPYDIAGRRLPFLIDPLPDFRFLDLEGARDVANQVADGNAIMTVVDALGRMNVTDQLAILLKHDDQRVS